MATATTRIHNFSAGPAVLPLEVLEQAQRDLLSLPGVGMSVLEISHRSAAFDEIIQGCEADIRKLANIPDNYHVLFLQGGASLQFSMVPMNLLPAGASADYIVTGVWAQKALKEAKRVGNVNVAASTESENFGRPVDVSKHGLIYAGAQKNLGPSGVTLVIVRDDLVERGPAALATMLQYKVHAENKSLYNTPPVFGVYIMRLVIAWLLKRGGLAAIEKENIRKAEQLYAEIDRTGFYRGHATPDSRSRMNVTFRLPNEELEKKFAKESTAAGLDGLKGHRSVGGLRASIYNAFPEAGVDALVQFMRDFEAKNG